MKYVGFIKEHSPIEEAIPFKLMSDSQQLSSELISQIVRYLNKGILVFGWMRYLHDLDSDEPICPDGYCTDGVWVWPMYFAHYLKKTSCYPFDLEFIDFIKSKNFINKINDLSVDKAAIEAELFHKYNEYREQP
ncbi:MAG TPA: hypothetical protein VIM65_21580 [Cyclobacteriaceae bacterium]